MTEQEIIELARKCGIDMPDTMYAHEVSDKQLERFAALHRAAIIKELLAVGMEPVASHTEKGFSQDAGLIWEETNLYSAEHLAAARLQGAEEERKKWQDNLHANVEYCPTCCEGKIASPDMTRDEVIFHCGKTSGRLQGEQRHAELEQQLTACKEGADRMQQVITAVENAMHSEVLNLDVEAAFDAYKAAHNLGGEHD